MMCGHGQSRQSFSVLVFCKIKVQMLASPFAKSIPKVDEKIGQTAYLESANADWIPPCSDIVRAR